MSEHLPDWCPQAPSADEPTPPQPLFELPVTRREFGLMVRTGLVGATVASLATWAALHETQQHDQIPEHLALEPENYKMDIPWLPTTVSRWHNSLEKHGQEYKVDPRFLGIIAMLESAGNPKAHSKSNAMGLVQILPTTAAEIAAKRLHEPRANYDIWNPDTNIEFGTAYFAFLRNFAGRNPAAKQLSEDEWARALAIGYNGGPSVLDGWLDGHGVTSDETVGYANFAYSLYRERNYPESPAFDDWYNGNNGKLRVAEAAKVTG